ncbi:MAG TPA: tetratricopeptide repeat protein [Candidatus Cloacimonadota bacterium]|nr:tetratricopeptide repeat protein [Candidatus Cloacimonadota bacterium]
MNKHVVMALLILSAISALFAQGIQDSYHAEMQGDYPNALAAVEQLAAGDPDELFYTMRIAWLQYLSGDYHTARTTYAKALNKLDHLDAHLGILNCQLALGEWSAALGNSTQLIARYPGNPMLLGKAAYAAFMKKDHALAAQYYGDILALYPWDLDSRAYYVNNLYLSGKIAEARHEYTTLKKYAPQSQMVIDYQGILDK